MKREIKFRAWDHEDGMMVYSEKEYDEHYFAIDGMAQAHRIYESTDSEGMPEPHSEEIKIMQYTGLKDGKETDIYEGDIVIVENSEPDENGEYDQITVCKWDKGGFTLEDNAGGHWSRQLFNQPERLEIIGNIYENPELL